MNQLIFLLMNRKSLQYPYSYLLYSTQEYFFIKINFCLKLFRYFGYSFSSSGFPLFCRILLNFRSTIEDLLKKPFEGLMFLAIYPRI